MDFNDFKEVCMRAGIKMTSFESMMDFSEFAKFDGLIPGNRTGLQDKRSSDDGIYE